MRSYLIELRKRKGLTQVEAAESLGISRAFYGMIESSTRNPTLDLAKKIAEFYESNLEDIFFNSKASKRSINNQKKAALS